MRTRDDADEDIVDDRGGIAGAAAASLPLNNATFTMTTTPSGAHAKRQLADLGGGLSLVAVVRMSMSIIFPNGGHRQALFDPCYTEFHVVRSSMVFGHA